MVCSSFGSSSSIAVFGCSSGSSSRSSSDSSRSRVVV